MVRSFSIFLLAAAMATAALARPPQLTPAQRAQVAASGRAFATFYYQTGILKKSFEVAAVAMNFASGAAFSGESTYFVLNPHEE